MNRISRQRFLGAGAGTAALSLLGQAAPADRRPNILFAIGDDWAWPHAAALRRQGEGRPRSTAWPARAYCSPRPTAPRRRALPFPRRDPHRPVALPARRGREPLEHLPANFQVYPDLLETGRLPRRLRRVRVVARARWRRSGRTRNPAGPQFKDFEAFLRGARRPAVLLLVRQHRPPSALRRGFRRCVGPESARRAGAAVPARHTGGPR